MVYPNFYGSSATSNLNEEKRMFKSHIEDTLQRIYVDSHGLSANSNLD